MSLPRPPAFPVRETVETGTVFSDPALGALIPIVPPAVGDEYTFTLVVPRLPLHQVEELRRLYKAKRTVGYWLFDRSVIDRGAPHWVWVRFEESLRTEWIRADQYRVPLVLRQKVEAVET